LTTFSQEALPLLAEDKRSRGDRTITVWSAGCSTGEEPYTLAMLATEAVPGMNVRIIATDINARVIGVAKRGIYSGRSLKDVTPAYLERFFTKVDDGYEVIPAVRQMVEFMLLNLVDKTRMRLVAGADIIFCRNVLIYFAHPVAKQVINYFYDSLNRGGYIFLGLAESMHLFSGAFKLVKFRELYGYMKE
jgi:chemotaxis protein methyltransferase CheR